MRRSRHAFALLAALAASCTGGQTGDEGVRGLDGERHSSGGKSASDAGTGVKGGGGNPVGCNSDLDCANRLDFLASMIAAPIDNPRTPIGSECLPAGKGCDERALCACVYEQDTMEEGPTNFVLGLGLNEPCDLYARDGTCLLPSDAFEGCDVDDASSCDAACAHALETWAKDDARTLAVKTRHASCAVAEHECRFVIEVEGMCHPTGGVEGAVYDCALDDDEILARAFAAGDAGPYDESGAVPQCSGGDGCAEGKPYGGPSCQLGTCETKVGRSMQPCSRFGGGADGGASPDPGGTP